MKSLIRSLFVLLLMAGCALAQEAAKPDVFKPGDNLVVEGVPAVPKSLANDVQRYTEFRAAFITDWDPMKREMLILTRFGNTYQVHEVKMPGGARSQLTFFPERVTFASFHPQAEDFFVFGKDTGGDEQYQFYRYDRANGAVTLLTDGKSRNTDFLWAYSGTKAVYGSTRRNNNDVDFWTMDPRDPKSDKMLVQNQGGGWSPLDWSPDEKQVVALEGISATESYLWLIDVATGKKTALTPKKEGAEQVAYSQAVFSKDGKGLFITTDRDSEFQRLAYMDLASGKIDYLTTAIPWDVSEFTMSRDGRTIAFVTNEDGQGVLHLLDTRSKKELPKPKLPAGEVSGLVWHENSVDLGFGMDSASSPSDVYSLNVKTGKVDRWTESETGGVVTTGFREPELIKWKSWDGRMISGFLYRPPAKFTGKRPVVINIHGGPEGQFQPGFLGSNNYYLDQLGVAIIFPNVRGSTGYGKTFLKMDNGFLREGSYKDIDTLLDWVKQQPDLDGSHIMITGGSYGGFMTLAVATNYDDKISCSLDIVGPSNLVTFLEHTSGYRVDLRRVEYGDERDPKMREYLEKIAPANHVDRIHHPLFVVAGKNDPRVPASESIQMKDNVKKNGTPVWFLMANDEGHGFAKKNNRDFLFYSTVMFMKECLLK